MVEYPKPHLDADNSVFWSGIRAGEFRLHRCSECGHWYYPASFCLCGAPWEAMKWTRASGDGVVVTWITYHHAFHPAFESRIPYSVAVMRCVEGPLFMARVSGIEADAILIDAPVSIGFERLTEDLVMPVIVPAK